MCIYSCKLCCEIAINIIRFCVSIKQVAVFLPRMPSYWVIGKDNLWSYAREWLSIEHHPHRWRKPGWDKRATEKVAAIAGTAIVYSYHHIEFISHFRKVLSPTIPVFTDMVKGLEFSEIHHLLYSECSMGGYSCNSVHSNATVHSNECL